MVSSRGLVAILIGVTIAAVLFIPINDAVTANTGDQDVTNESVTATVGEYEDLDGYDIEQDSETVYWYNTTSGSYEEVTSGTDYEMDYGPGAIKALEGGTISDGDDLKVTYTYQATDPITTTVVVLVPLFVALLMLVVLARPMMEAM